jgi:hypothetical protein
VPEFPENVFNGNDDVFGEVTAAEFFHGGPRGLQTDLVLQFMGPSSEVTTQFGLVKRLAADQCKTIYLQDLPVGLKGSLE